MPSAPLLTRLSLLATLLVVGCGEAKPSKTPETKPPEATNAATQPTPPVQPSNPAKSAAIRDKAGKIEFSYEWPAAAASIAELDSWIRGNGEHLRARTMGEGRAEEAEARKNDYELSGYSYDETWGVAADIPTLLVLQSDGYVFTGGAHGMPIVTTLLWDKAAKKRLAVGALLDQTALIAAIKDRFCKALDAERAKRRGAPVDASDPNELDDFVKCVDPAKQTILPVSVKGKALDTIRIVIMPYEAGPYAEGIYQIDLPVDAAVLATVKPAWRGSFSGG